MRYRNGNFYDIIQSRENKLKPKVGDSDCGFFVIKSSIVKNKLKHLIKRNLIITSETKEIDFLKSFKYLKKIGNVQLTSSKNYKDTIGVNFLEDLI